MSYGPFSQGCKQHPTTRNGFPLPKQGRRSATQRLPAEATRRRACPRSSGKRGLLPSGSCSPPEEVTGSGFCGQRKIQCFLEHLAALPCKDKKCQGRQRRASLQPWDRGCRDWGRALDALIHIATRGGRNLYGGCAVVLADFCPLCNLLLPSRALPKALVFESVLFAPGH